MPASRSNAGFDALIWDEDAKRHWPVDFTVGETHGIHAAGLLRAVEHLGWTSERGWSKPASAAPPDRTIKYLWIVPADQFDRGWRKAQALKVTTSASPVVDSMLALLRAHVKQYVLRVPPALDISRLDEALEAAGVRSVSELAPAHPAPGANAARAGAGPSLATSPVPRESS